MNVVKNIIGVAIAVFVGLVIFSLITNFTAGTVFYGDYATQLGQLAGLIGIVGVASLVYVIAEKLMGNL